MIIEEKVGMAGELKQVQLNSSQLEEKLNHLEYVVKNTKRDITSFKKGSLKD